MLGHNCIVPCHHIRDTCHCGSAIVINSSAKTLFANLIFYGNCSLLMKKFALLLNIIHFLLTQLQNLYLLNKIILVLRRLVTFFVHLQKSIICVVVVCLIILRGAWKNPQKNLYEKNFKRTRTKINSNITFKIKWMSCRVF